MSEGELIDRLQAQVADRERVDWEALAPDLEASDSATPDDLEALALLRLLDELGVVNAAFQRGEFEPLKSPEASTQLLVGPQTPRIAEDDDTLASWGRYTLEEKVGRGGFGSVYRAWDPALQIPVAIKILHRRYRDDQLTERLLHEGRALAQLKHPHVVRVLNVEQHDGRVGLVMEFLRGRTLDEIVSSGGTMNYREATVVAEDVCRALTAVHMAGLVHRDVKARNIIREHDGRIVLMDFGAGLSHTAGRDETGVVGTPLYMAPEVMRGGHSSAAGDVYGVGVLLFHLVTRRYPFEGQSVEEIRAAQARGGAQPLLTLRSDLPRAFVKVVERALAVDPRERFATPGALLQALLDARTVPRDWAQVAMRVLAGVAGLALMLTAGGAISSGVFNAALGRQVYATESFVEWFVLGRRSLVMPLLLALMGVTTVGAIIAIRNVLVPVVPGILSMEQRTAKACSGVANRLGLADPRTASSWLALLTGGLLVAIGLYWAPLVSAVMSDLATAPADALSVFSDAQVEYRTYFRMALSLLVAANVTGWYGLSCFARARGARMPGWIAVTEVALLFLLFVSMQVPYRIVHDNDEFPVATWQSQRCHVLGQRQNETLLFCPEAQPRRQLVSSSDVRIVPGVTRESLFVAFAPSTR